MHPDYANDTAMANPSSRVLPPNSSATGPTCRPPLKSPTSAVTESGDFNGDGKQDVASVVSIGVPLSDEETSFGAVAHLGNTNVGQGDGWGLKQPGTVT